MSLPRTGSGGDYSAEYTYDLVGNRIASAIDGVHTAYTYDANDRLIQAGGERYTYDANGNTLRVEIDSDETTYQYDDRNRMVASTNTVGSITTSSSYRYDIDDNRVQQTIDGETTDYTLDRNRDFAQVIRESNPSRDITYTHGDDLISQHSPAGAFYYYYDGLGSTRALTDAGQTVTDTYDYEAFGVLLNRTGFTENNYRFTGEQYDPNLDQYYLRARYYNQNIGRFTQMDTFQGVGSDPVTLHKYLYANADPVNNIDPSGNFSLVSFAVAQDIRSTLSSVQVDVGSSLLDAALDPDNAARNTAIGIGVTAIVGLGGVKLVKILSKKTTVTTLATNKGKVTVLNKARQKEVDAAVFLAENTGAQIAVRGNNIKGADFILNGNLWELKTLNSATDTAVSRNIRDAKRQSSRIIIDGRNAGLTQQAFVDGLARARRNGADAFVVKVILRDGEIQDWFL